MYEYTTRGSARHSISPALIPSMPDTLRRGAYAGLDLGEGLNLALSVFSAGIHIRGIPRMCFWF